jgi:hypothetical protein
VSEPSSTIERRYVGVLVVWVLVLIALYAFQQFFS